jgi:Ras-related protein Rap-1A
VRENSVFFFFCVSLLLFELGEVFVVVYSIVAESTFFETKEIREQILDTKDPVIPPIVLVGNKLDLADERTVTKGRAEQQAKEWDCPYLECSAKANENIEVTAKNCSCSFD